MRHLKTQHGNEKLVKEALTLTKKERIKAINTIKKKGIYKVNIELRKKGKELLRERTQGSEKNKNLEMCGGCKGFYSKRRIKKHLKKCDEGIDGIKTSLDVRHIGDEDNVTEFTRNVLDKFRTDETGRLCRNDPVVVRLGQKLWAKSARKERKNIMNHMRLLGNLIMEFRKAAHNDDLHGEDLLKRKHFPMLTKAIQQMSYTETGVLKYGLKMAIGYLLKNVIKVMKGNYIQQENNEAQEEVDRFSALLDLEWDFIFYGAQIMCEQRRQTLRKPGNMPLETDLLKFRNYILERTKALTSDIYNKWDFHDFTEMRNLIVARLTLFNARRGGEPARLLLSEWRDANKDAWIDQQQLDSIMSSHEKDLVKDMKLAFQTGKGSRRLVPVIFPKDMITPIEKLIEEREECGISGENLYLFPNTGLSRDHVTGWHSIQIVAKQMGDQLKKPSLLTADNFRHRTSTLFASLELPRDKREAFYRHMGHSEDINRDVYQCPLALRELTEVGSFLHNLDNGVHHKNQQIQNEGEQSIETSHTGVEKHVDKPQAEQHDAPNPVIQVDHIDSSEEPRQKIRRYRKWSVTDAAKVEHFYSNYINDKDNHFYSKGAVPSQKSVLEFLVKNTIFQDENICQKELISLIKTKAFNTRKKNRETLS